MHRLLANLTTILVTRTFHNILAFDADSLNFLWWSSIHWYAACWMLISILVWGGLQFATVCQTLSHSLCKSSSTITNSGEYLAEQRSVSEREQIKRTIQQQKPKNIQQLTQCSIFLKFLQSLSSFVYEAIKFFSSKTSYKRESSSSFNLKSGSLSILK